MAGKMEPGTWSVCNIRVRFLGTSGRDFCKELGNAVCKEGLAYSERVGRFKERKKMQVTLQGNEPASRNLT